MLRRLKKQTATPPSARTAATAIANLIKFSEFALELAVVCANEDLSSVSNVPFGASEIRGTHCRRRSGSAARSTDFSCSARSRLIRFRGSGRSRRIDVGGTFAGAVPRRAWRRCGSVSTSSPRSWSRVCATRSFRRRRCRVLAVVFVAVFRADAGRTAAAARVFDSHSLQVVPFGAAERRCLQITRMSRASTTTIARVQCTVENTHGRIGFRVISSVEDLISRRRVHDVDRLWVLARLVAERVGSERSGSDKFSCGTLNRNDGRVRVQFPVPRLVRPLSELPSGLSKGSSREKR